MTKRGTMALMAMVTVMAAGSAVPSPALEGQAPLPALTMWQAERDFDAVRAELGLSGSAPLVGLEPQRAVAVASAAPVQKTKPTARRAAARRSPINRSTILP